MAGTGRAGAAAVAATAAALAVRHRLQGAAFTLPAPEAPVLEAAVPLAAPRTRRPRGFSSPASKLEAPLRSGSSRAAPRRPSSRVARASAAQAAFDLNRARVRLEGLSNYGVISALILNASLRLFTSTPLSGDNKTKVERIVTCFFCIAVSLSSFAGAYSTVVFTLLCVYTKTALGMGLDSQYVLFFDAMAKYRTMGFRCFLVSLGTFNIALALSVFLRTKGKMRYLWTSACATLSLLMMWDWHNIIRLASQYVFH